VSSRSAGATRAAAIPAVTAAPKVTLQRQCKCGQHTIAGGECAQCAEKKGEFHRYGARKVGLSVLPSSLVGPHYPFAVPRHSSLQPSTGRDFSDVRAQVESDATPLPWDFRMARERRLSTVFDPDHPLRAPISPPRLKVRSFGTGRSGGSCAANRARGESAAGDKSLRVEDESQDQSLSVGKFAQSPCGVSIEVGAGDTSAVAAGAIGGAFAGLGVAGIGLGIAGAAGAAVGTGTALGILGGGAVLGGLIGGLLGRRAFSFTQTIHTNAPLGGSTSPYVDPRPNDDNKPFYWTDAEQATHGNTFLDAPCRPAPGTGTTNWDATLCMNAVNEKQIVACDCLTYGFSRGSAGAITTRSPKKASASAHQSVLSSEFPGWTFVSVESKSSS
jgi:hypothetical protein